MKKNSFLENIYHDSKLEKREIDLIVCHVLNINTAALFIYDNEIPTDKKETIQFYCKQRIEGKPLAYITGEKDFWNLTLKVNEHTLIPRPETEQIVELVLNKTDKNYTGKILDLGTGTGAIALSIASERPKAQIFAVDFSEHCIQVATGNSNKYQLSNVEIKQSDWFENLQNEKFDIIVSNPPYIAENDSHLNDLKYEPILALTAKKNGLSDLLHIINNSPKYLNDNGLVFLEHGYDQAITVREYFNQFCYRNVNSHNDLAGIPRITSAEFLKSCY